MKRRNDFTEIINQRGYTVAVEVGVGWGGFSELLLSSCSGITLYSVDPWSPQGAEYRPESKEYTEARLSKYGERSKIMVMTSLSAAALIPDNSVDFVYIDGDHGGEAVSADCASWWPKIRSGGIMAGHDYQESRSDLRGAVDAHAASVGQKVQVTDGEMKWEDSGKEQGEEASSPSWWYEKQ